MAHFKVYRKISIFMLLHLSLFINSQKTSNFLLRDGVNKVIKNKKSNTPIKKFSIYFSEYFWTFPTTQLTRMNSFPKSN